MERLERITLRAYARVLGPRVSTLCDSETEFQDALALVRRLIAAHGDVCDCIPAGASIKLQCDVRALGFALECMNQTDWLWPVEERK